jgi:ABC-type multidrug transport system fused ATPase/permease subunit
MEAMIPMIVIPTIFFAIAWIVRSISTNRRLRDGARSQAEVQMRLLEKFGTAPDLQKFLESEPGRKFVEGATIERANPFGKVLSALQSGVITMLAGTGFLATRSVLGSDAYQPFTLLGTMALLIGAGFIVSAALVYFLSKHWGLLPERAGKES